MAIASGVVLEKTLHEFHFGDVERVIDNLMIDHEAGGCRYAGGRDAARKVVMAEFLVYARAFLADRLEDPRIEVYCPHRDGVKKAA